MQPARVIMNIRPGTPDDHPQLLAIWQESVRATHSFLSDADITGLLPIVRDIALPQLELWVLCNEGSVPVGFMGLSGSKVEALFLAPSFFGRGGGRQLLSHARRLKGALTVDVNEQNPSAIEFYRSNGFKVIARSPLDSDGRPFPLLHLQEVDAWTTSRRCSAALRSVAVALAALIAAAPVMLVAAYAGEDPTPVSSHKTASPERGPGPIDPTELAALVDPVFAAGMKEERIPGAAFVFVQNGRVLLSRGFGQADVASGRPVRPDQTIFPFASISKVLTATAVMQLAELGRVDLDADVNQYLKAVQVPPTYQRPITVAHLLTHTSGLDELPGRRVRNAAELVPLERFLAERLIRVHAPGEVTSYSSYGMALAGLLVEDISGQPFEEYLRRHIWEPLGMARTFITVPSAFSADLATAYEPEGEELVAIPYELYQTSPTSSIVGTAEDMARFMIAHLENGRYGDVRILSEAAATNMHDQHATMHPLVPGWALGFQLDDTNGRRVIEHGGDIGGFSALITLLPDEGVGMFVVHHLESRNLRFDVRRAILDRYFPDQRQLKVPTPEPKTAETLTRFAGAYRANNFCHSCPDGGPNVQDFEVKANDDGTITLWDTRWVEVSPFYFVSLDGRRRIGFAEDKSGRIVAVTSGAWRVLERIH